MKKLAAIIVLVLALGATAVGGTLMAADPGPIAPGGSTAIDR